MIRVPELPLPISEVAMLVGCTPAEIHDWAERLGWPAPTVVVDDEALYAPATIDALRRVVALRNAGRPIATLIVNGRPNLPEARRRQRPDLSDLPQPRTSVGAATHRMVLRLAEHGHTGETVRRMADLLSTRVPPEDRASVMAIADRVDAADAASAAGAA